MGFETRRLIVIKTGRNKIFDAITAKDKATGKKFYTPSINGATLRKAWKSKTSAMKYAEIVQLRYILLLESKLKLLQERENDAQESETEDDAGEVGSTGA